uniref:NADH dehydrogenase subunit 6 n=1 Tax=Julodis variolaris TaxID=3025997 RepID=UPI0023AB3185|nr:NADH dehydrogenase subunit 6 [Julodis variolaris]WCO87689.1 NADH dehydrogenase subunit 6 [Julodis variolaris]
MLLIMMMASLALSMSFLFLKHPLSMGFALLLQSVMISLITGIYNYNFWYSYIIFLIMIGGMLVLFIYMTSIASNEKFEYSNGLTLMIILLTSMSVIITLLMDKFFIYQNIMNTSTTLLHQSDWTLSLSKYLSYPMNMIMFMLFIYLFITLVAVVKITDISYGPLRQKF